ncbi:MAG: H-NS histone family protein [Proteobacteria bacterium]|nr:H-NS histone family protein [Pseudomonadota bacterium]
MASQYARANVGSRKLDSDFARITRSDLSIEPSNRFDLKSLVPELDDFVRFRDPESGRTWCGYGRPPEWIRGQDRERFRVQQSALRAG